MAQPPRPSDPSNHTETPAVKSVGQLEPSQHRVIDETGQMPSYHDKIPHQILFGEGSKRQRIKAVWKHSQFSGVVQLMLSFLGIIKNPVAKWQKEWQTIKQSKKDFSDKAEDLLQKINSYQAADLNAKDAQTLQQLKEQVADGLFGAKMPIEQKLDAAKTPQSLFDLYGELAREYSRLNTVFIFKVFNMKSERMDELITAQQTIEEKLNQFFRESRKKLDDTVKVHAEKNDHSIREIQDQIKACADKVNFLRSELRSLRLDKETCRRNLQDLNSRKQALQKEHRLKSQKREESLVRVQGLLQEVLEKINRTNALEELQKQKKMSKKEETEYRAFMDQLVYLEGEKKQHLQTIELLYNEMESEKMESTETLSEIEQEIHQSKATLLALETKITSTDTELMRAENQLSEQQQNTNKTSQQQDEALQTELKTFARNFVYHEAFQKFKTTEFLWSEFASNYLKARKEELIAKFKEELISLKLDPNQAESLLQHSVIFSPFLS